jgi:Putative zinc-finger
MRRLSRMMLTCQDMSRLLSDAMDRTLPLHMRVRMRAHLWICALCERYKQQLTLLRDVLRKNGTRLNDDARAENPRLSPEAKARIQRALDSHRS